MKNKILKSTLVVAILTIAGYGGMNVYDSCTLNQSNTLLTANIEALTYIETNTTWMCNSEKGQLLPRCSASCGSCGTKVESVGQLFGFHSCWEVK